MNDVILGGKTWSKNESEEDKTTVAENGSQNFLNPAPVASFFGPPFLLPVGETKRRPNLGGRGEKRGRTNAFPLLSRVLPQGEKRGSRRPSKKKRAFIS